MGATIGRTDGERLKSLNSIDPKPRRGNGHLEWLLQRHKDKKAGRDRVSVSFLEGLLDQPLFGNNEKDSKDRSFLDELLSEPLFDNERAKTVIENQKTPNEIINIPVSPTMAMVKSTEQLPGIFYPPLPQDLQSQQDHLKELAVDSLEFVKKLNDERERIGDETDSTSRPHRNTGIDVQWGNSTKDNHFDIFDVIPNINELIENSLPTDNTIGILTADRVLGFNNRGSDSKSPIRVGYKKIESSEINNTPVPEDEENRTEAPSRRSSTAAPFIFLPKKVKKSDNKKILHHLVYLFPSKVKITAKVNKKNLHSQRKISTTKIRNKDLKHHNQAKVKSSDNLRNFFLPQSHFEILPPLYNYQYGTLFPNYSYHLYDYRTEMEPYVSNSFDDYIMFPHTEVYHRSQSSHRKQSVSVLDTSLFI